MRYPRKSLVAAKLVVHPIAAGSHASAGYDAGYDAGYETAGRSVRPPTVAGMLSIKVPTPWSPIVASTSRISIADGRAGGDQNVEQAARRDCASCISRRGAIRGQMNHRGRARRDPFMKTPPIVFTSWMYLMLDHLFDGARDQYRREAGRAPDRSCCRHASRSARSRPLIGNYGSVRRANWVIRRR